MHVRRTAATLAAAALLLAGCGSDADSASSDDAGHAADVTFATEMIPHHAQALTMVDLTQGRHLSPAMTRLTEQIRDAQAPEIETMADWLDQWGEPVPATERDHMHADMGDMGDMSDTEDMPGMMSAEEMDALAKAPDSEFEDLWLELMIQHHEGALEMAQTEIEDGEYAPAIKLAHGIEASQQAEIDHMKAMLSR